MARSKEEKREFQAHMQRMVDELNALRDEAAEKVGDVPKGYKLYTWKDDAKSALGFLGIVLVLFAIGGSFMWFLEHEIWVAATVYTVVLFIAWMVAGARRHRPYRVEEHVHEYWANIAHHGAVVEELDRLKNGILEYDRQYRDQKEYIKKFRELVPEVEDFGRLDLVLKASGFYARVRMKSQLDEIDCRLNFNEEDYRVLLSYIEFFNLRAA